MASEPSGPSIAGYELIGTLGAGGAGTVHLAVQTSLGRLVAIKQLSGIAPGADVIRRFRREARTLARMDHPNIVRVHDFVVDGDSLYLVLEYVDGTSLRSLRLSQPQALAVVREVASALTYLNGRGVVHRDIKPENVLVSEAGQCKVTDFGIAKIVTESLLAGAGGSAASVLATEAGTIIGTLAYISPEAASGRTDIGPAADVYSLAVMTYELLVGRLPFADAPSFYLALLAHTSEPPPLPSEVSPGFPSGIEAVLLRGLEKDPARRPRSAARFWSDLEETADRAWPGWRSTSSLAGVVDQRAAPGATEGAPEALVPTVVGPGTPHTPPNRDRDAGPSLPVVPEPVSPGAAGRAPVDRHRLVLPSDARGRHRRSGRRSRRVVVVGVVLVVCAMAATAISLWVSGRRHPAKALVFAVERATITAAPAQGHCPATTFAFTATLGTRGGSGTLRFAWQRPDGTTGPTETQLVAAGAGSVTETLQFTFSGSRSAVGAARLLVLAPTEVASDPVTVRFICP